MEKWTYISGRVVDANGKTIAEVDPWESVPRAEADKIGERIAKLPEMEEAHEELVAALKGLVDNVQLSKLNIRKDFSLMNAHAYATKVLAKAGKVGGENGKERA